ncbi:MAG: hypothetical protein AABO41_25930 [Acidobacteriota bacterium]
MSRSKYKPALSLLLASAVASVFAISSFAASKPREPTPGVSSTNHEGKGILGLPSGRLIGTGQITVDGSEAQSGVTVLSGSTVATGADGNATIELGALGRIELQPNTTVLVTLAPDMVAVKIIRVGRVVQSLPSGVRGHTRIEGGKARLAVSLGQVEVKSGSDQRTLGAGDESSVSPAGELLANGNVAFTIDDGSARASSARKGGYVSAGAVGMVALAGVAAAATGVVLSNRSDSGSSEALPRPSTVVP